MMIISGIRVPIVLTISSFKFHQVKLPWPYRHGWVTPIHPTSVHGLSGLGQCWVLS